jgi:hypothetical protein
MDNQQIAILKLDLIMTGAHTIQPIRCPYVSTDEWPDAMVKVYNDLQQSSHDKQRIHTLINAFYMGKLIESSITPREKWTEFVQQNSIKNERRNYLGSTRVYKLFMSNVDQIYCTQHMTFRKIARLNNQQFKELMEFKESYERDFVI